MEKIYNFYVLSSEDDPENVRYVGTTTKTVEKRFYQHKYCATHPEKRGLPVHKWMYSVYLKGGKILVKQIDSCNENEWEKRELDLISHYRNHGYNLMNLDKGGKGIITKEKRSKPSIERSIKGHNIPIVALNMDGTFFKEFKSIVEATEYCKLKSRSAINNVLKHRAKSSAGYMWIYKSEYLESNKYKYLPKTTNIPIYQFDLSGNLLKEWHGVRYMDSVDGYSQNGVRHAIDTKKIYHDSYWSKNKSINILDFEKAYNYKVTYQNKEYLFRKQSEICKFTNFGSATICNILKETPKVYKEYKFEKI